MTGRIKNERRCIKALNDEPPIDYKQLSTWQLRRLGYTIEQTAQIMSIGTTTVKRWDMEVDKYMTELPAVRLAIDYVKTMIPSALAAYDRALKGSDIRLAKDTAKDILGTFSIIQDKQYVVPDDRAVTDNELVEEAERILAQHRDKVAADNEGTEKATG